MNDTISVVLRNIRLEAAGIHSYILEPLPGETLPAFEPGAHADIQVAPGLVRSYSLLNHADEPRFYEIAVHRTADSRGGSAHIHEHWRVGDRLEILRLKNHFPLEEDATHSLLIAGGIGITPMLPMIHRLQTLGRSWELHYVAASPERAAYVDRLRDLPQANVVFDGVPGGARLDLAAICRAAPADTHLYCCGPAGMLDGFRQATHDRPTHQVHLEQFTADTEIARDGGYEVELARSRRTLCVAEGDSLLDTLLSAGVPVGFACSEGVCGSCQVAVLAGTPDHRDHFLSEQEKAANTRIMVCCSGARSSRLVLDL